MRKIIQSVALVFLAPIVLSAPLFADVKFSNPNARIVVNSGSTLGVRSAVTGWDGTLVRKGTVSGQPISFNDGILDSQGTPIRLTGQSNSALAQIFLTSNQKIRYDAGQALQSVVALRSGNRLEGQPVFTQSSALSLVHHLSGLTLAVNSPLSSSIALNGGTLTLDNDVSFVDDCKVTGSGIINVNGRRFGFGGPRTGASLAMTSTLFWNDASDVTLNGPLSLSGTWTFNASTANNQPCILGNGNTLDLTQRGTIWVKKNTTLRLRNLKLKGFGRGGFVMEDKTSQVRLSRVEIEMANSYTMTSGGIYVDGSTTFVTKNGVLTFDLRASLTIDGTTLWYDPGSYTGADNIQPLVDAPSNPSGKNVVYLNGGVIREVGSGGGGVDSSVDVRTNSNALLYLTKNNSNALLYGNRTNSNVIVLLDRNLRTSSNALLYGDRVNSNALLYGDRTNSNAIVLLDRNLRTNSNAMLYSDRVTSNALLYLTRVNSNALLYGNRTNSSAIEFLSRNLRTNSNAMLYGDRVTSNALLYGDRVNSNAIGLLVRNVRTNSNAFVVIDALARNDSIFLQAAKQFTGFETWTGSGQYYDTHTTTSFTVYRGGTGYIKNAPITWAGGQSVTGLTPGFTYTIYIDKAGQIGFAIGESDAVIANTIVLFNCLVDVDSNQIVAADNYSAHIPWHTRLYASEMIGTVILNENDGANITLSGTQKISIVGDDEILLPGIETEIIAGADKVFHQMYTNGSGKWVRYAQSDTFTGVYNNAGTVTALGAGKFSVYRLYVANTDLNTGDPVYVAVIDGTEHPNLTAAQTAIDNGTPASASFELEALEMAQLGYIVYDKDQEKIVDVTVAKSTLRQGVSTSGSTIASLISTSVGSFDTVLGALDTNVQQAFNSIDDWGRTTSNAIALLDTRVDAHDVSLRTNSNALVYGDRVNSNAIGLLSRNLRTNSNALLFGDRVNSNAIIGLLERADADEIVVRTHSNALLYADRVNSNAIMTLFDRAEADEIVVRTHSNALLYGDRVNSNAIIGLLERAEADEIVVRTHSNALLYGDRVNSNAILGLLERADADEIVVRTHSNALLYGDRVNSNAILGLLERAEADEIVVRTHSNALLYGDRVNSNAIGLLDRNVRTNSNALVATDALARNDSIFLQAAKQFTGFETWTGSGQYYDTHTTTSFTVYRGGTGYIKNAPITWAGGQSVTGLTPGFTYTIYIDKAGQIGFAIGESDAVIANTIVLFNCLVDVNGNQIVAADNYSAHIPWHTRLYASEMIGTVILNENDGANITLSGTQKISLVGDDEILLPGIETEIIAGADKVFHQMYTNGAGKWVRYAQSDTFTGVYNNAGTVTALGAGKFSVYRLYVANTDLNTGEPVFVAVIDGTEHPNLTAAQTAIDNGTPASASFELEALEMAQLGYIVYDKDQEKIVDVTVAKSTLRQGVSTSGSTIASLISTSVGSFDTVLGALDTNVQQAFNSIDDWGRTTSNAIALLDTRVDAHDVSLRTNSNALVYGDRVNSNAIGLLSSNVRTNSNAIALISAYQEPTKVFTGFGAWSGSAPYYDTHTTTSFTLLRAGSGYIRNKLVTWSGNQSITGLTGGRDYRVFINETGTLSFDTVGTATLFNNNIELFNVWQDVNNRQSVIKENHPYQFVSTISTYEHFSTGMIISNVNGGANIALADGQTQKIKIVGQDFVIEHGLSTVIPDSGGAGVAFHHVYRNADGKWINLDTTDTFTGIYRNNNGTPVSLSAGKFGLYSLYVTLDNLNSSTPTYFAVLDETEYDTHSAVDVAVASATFSAPTNELKNFGLVHLGCIAYSKADNEISDIHVFKQTLQNNSGSAGSSASLITTLADNFDGALSSLDTTVQTAFDTLDDWTRTTSNAIALISAYQEPTKVFTGFASWSDSGQYFDTHTTTSFTLYRGGTGYIRNKLVTWSGNQSITGLPGGYGYWFYIDTNGNLGKDTVASSTLFSNNIMLFEMLQDPNNTQMVVKENHPYQFIGTVSSYLHSAVGTIINNSNEGANITLIDGQPQKIKIVTSDTLSDHGLSTTIPDSGGAAVTFHHMYRNGNGKWTCLDITDTFTGIYRNTNGTPVSLSAGKFGVYTLYASKDNLNASTPVYFAVLDETEYDTHSAADTAIVAGSVQAATNELSRLEMARLGYIVYSQADNEIIDVHVDKETLRGSADSTTASLLSVVTDNFDGALSSLDITVQGALDTLDDWTRTSSNALLYLTKNNSNAIKLVSDYQTATKVFTGFASWTGSGAYYDTHTTTSFTVYRGGTGYLSNKPISWSGNQSVTGLTSGTAYWVYIDGNGVLQASSIPSGSIFNASIRLFEVLITPNNTVIVAKENHPYDFLNSIGSFFHSSFNTIIYNANGGANITKVTTNKIGIDGTDTLADHGLPTTIADSASQPVSFYHMYTNGSGKWESDGLTDTFDGRYNSAGTLTDPGSGYFVIRTLYAIKDNLNSSAAQYLSVYDTAAYESLAAARGAIAHGNVVVPTNELSRVEAVRLGYIIYATNPFDEIVDVIIAKETLRTSKEEIVASLTTLVTDNFNGSLNSLDATVQQALDSLDDWSRTTSDAIVLLDVRADAVDVSLRTNSNTLLYLTKNNSNTLLALNSGAVDVSVIHQQLGMFDHGPANIHVDTTTTMSFNYYLGTSSVFSHKLFVYGGSSVTLDGSGHAIYFSREASDTLIDVDAGTTLVLQNVVLKDFLIRYIGLGVGADVIFGQGTTVELADDDVMPTSNLTKLRFQGTSVVSGAGHDLDISTQGNAIEVAPGAQVTLHDMHLFGLHDYNMRCLSPSARIVLSDATLLMSDNYTFSEGTMTFSGDVMVRGRGHTFAYQSAEQSIVTPDAIVTIDKGVTLSCDSGNYERNAATRQPFILQSSSAAIHLDNCTLHSTYTGIQLTKGQLLIDNLVTFSSQGRALSEAITIGDGTVANDLTLHLLAGAELSVYGLFDYRNTQ